MGEVQDLEALYSPSQWSKRYDGDKVLEKHVEFIEEHSRIVRERTPSELGIPYGPGDKDKFDLYGTDLKDGGPILIHIHGGYYQEKLMNHSNNGFISNVLYQNGIKTILLGYELSPQRPLRDILEQLQVGLRKIIEYAKKFKSPRIYLSGHSVGAHAIATILTNFKRSIPPEDADLIKGAFLLCGVYDLEPVTKMSANVLLNLSAEVAQELSPLLHKVDYGNTTIYVVASENDSPAFVEQSEQFYDKLRRDGTECYFQIVPVVDHFDIVENLYRADFELTKFIVGVINQTN